MKLKINKIRFKANRKGVSLLWALVVLCTVILVITGLLMMAQIFHTRESTEIRSTRADYYARSAVQIMSQEIAGGDVTDLNKDYVIEITDGNQKIPVNVNLDNSMASYQVTITASYTIGTTTEKVKGIMIKKGTKWGFNGYLDE